MLIDINYQCNKLLFCNTLVESHSNVTIGELAATEEKNHWHLSVHIHIYTVKCYCIQESTFLFHNVHIISFLLNCKFILCFKYVDFQNHTRLLHKTSNIIVKRSKTRDKSLKQLVEPMIEALILKHKMFRSVKQEDLNPHLQLAVFLLS